MSIFTRASVYANLSPAERAFLRFLGLLALGALLAGAQAVMPLLSSATSANPLDLGSVPWTSVLHTFLTAAVIAVGSGISKYHQAQGDPPLPSAGAYSSTPPATFASISAPLSAPQSTQPPASTLGALPGLSTGAPTGAPTGPTAGGA